MVRSAYSFVLCNWTNKQEDIHNGTTSQIVLDTRRHNVNAVQYVFAIIMDISIFKVEFLVDKERVGGMMTTEKIRLIWKGDIQQSK